MLLNALLLIDRAINILHTQQHKKQEFSHSVLLLVHKNVPSRGSRKKSVEMHLMLTISIRCVALV
jgi:hypothetical protein